MRLPGHKLLVTFEHGSATGACTCGRYHATGADRKALREDYQAHLHQEQAALERAARSRHINDLADQRAALARQLAAAEDVLWTELAAALRRGEPVNVSAVAARADVARQTIYNKIGTNPEG